MDISVNNRSVRLFVAEALVALAGTSATVAVAARGAAAPTPAHAAAAAPILAELSAGAWQAASLGAIDPKVFQLALRAASCAVRSGAAAHPSTLTVIDYSKPSTDSRLWVFDLASHSMLFRELVAHGQGSGANFATRFSDEPDTHESSLGLFVTEDTYVGHNGYSLRLDGLDRGFNDRARDRAIVMHGARYVSAEIARATGRLGRSWGCPALREAIARQVIDRVKGGGLLFAYYPDPKWLASSKFLGDCGG